MLFKFLPDYVKKSVKERIILTVSQSAFSNKIQDELKRLGVQIDQLQESQKIYNGLLTPAPQKLQERIVGGYFNDFVRSGNQCVEELSNALEKAGKTYGDFGSVLDFGCGVGRILICLKKAYPHLDLYGCDIDSEGINYCQSVLSNYGTFKLNPFAPPSLFDSNKFDFIYGISVFSHLPEDLQFAWLSELKRISKPDGILILSIENIKSRVILSANQLDELLEKGFYYFDGDKTQGLPEFYKTTLHTHEYINTKWAKYFEIIDIIPKGIMNHQDLIICRNN